MHCAATLHLGCKTFATFKPRSGWLQWRQCRQFTTGFFLSLAFVIFVVQDFGGVFMESSWLCKRMLFFLSCAAWSVNLGTCVLISLCVFNADSSCPHIYFLISPNLHQHAIKLFEQKTWLCLSQSLHERFFPSPQSASSNHSPWRVNLGKTRPGFFTCFRKTRISSLRILTFSSCSSLYDTFSMFAIFLVLFPLFF